MSLTDNAIAELVAAGEAKEIVVLSVEDIDPDPEQPRQQRSEESVLELAQTIRSEGQLQPILVYESGDRYRILVGEGRWRACHHIPDRTVEAIITSKPAAQRILVAQLIENIQREAMHPLDEARAFQRLIDMRACKSAADVARTVGKSEATISQALKLLRMPEPIRELVKSGVAKTDAALDLHVISQHDPEAAEQLADEARAKGLLERKKTREVKQRLEEAEAPARADKAKGKAAAQTAQAKPKAPVAADRPVSVKAGAIRVVVGIKPGSKHAAQFRAAVEDGVSPMLLANGVHADKRRAWVEFGEGRLAFPVDDLVIVAVQEG